MLTFGHFVSCSGLGWSVWEAWLRQGVVTWGRACGGGACKLVAWSETPQAGRGWQASWSTPLWRVPAASSQPSRTAHPPPRSAPPDRAVGSRRCERARPGIPAGAHPLHAANRQSQRGRPRPCSDSTVGGARPAAGSPASMQRGGGSARGFAAAGARPASVGWQGVQAPSWRLCGDQRRMHAGSDVVLAHPGLLRFPPAPFPTDPVLSSRADLACPHLTEFFHPPPSLAGLLPRRLPASPPTAIAPSLPRPHSLPRCSSVTAVRRRCRRGEQDEHGSRLEQGRPRELTKDRCQGLRAAQGGRGEN